MPKTYHKHPFARLAHFNNHPVLISGRDTNAVEILNGLGVWENSSVWDWPFSRSIFDYAAITKYGENAYDDSYILLFGGQTDDGESSDLIAKFTTNSLQRWEIVGHLRQRRFAHSVIEDPISQRIIVLGGDNLRNTEILIEASEDPYEIEYHSHLIEQQLFDYKKYPLLILRDHFDYCVFP